MAENVRTQCTGNCMGCTIFQRQYCASQIAYNNMRTLDELAKRINDLSISIEAIQSTEGMLFNPMEDKEEKSEKPILPKAQEASGAEK